MFSSPSSFALLYQNDQTEYTFEKQTVRGKAAIQQKLVSIQRAQAVPKDVVGHLIMSQGGMGAVSEGLSEWLSVIVPNSDSDQYPLPTAS